MRAFKRVLLPPMKLSLQLTDLTLDVCGCKDISSRASEQKNKTGQIAASAGSVVPRGEHISRVERWGGGGGSKTT